MQVFRYLGFVCLALMQCSGSDKKTGPVNWPDNIRVILDNTKELEYERGNMFPLYLWPAIDRGNLHDMEAEILVRELDKRGIALVSSWNMKNREESLSRGMAIARAQKKLGLKVNIEATSLLYSFFDGSDSTAHVDENGKLFFDESFGAGRKMGCPFTLDSRKLEIRERVEYFLKRYREEGLPVGFIFADWEVDGPLEVNHAYEASRKCARCCQNLGAGFSFEKFQKTIREMRSYLQQYVFSGPVRSYFPDALVGNYAVYPNDGYRYWYDYFEFYNPIQPCKTEQKATYRKWVNDFPLTGYTAAMPVVYPWKDIFGWYDFENTDYRWFYNMLLNASNAGRSTPVNIPIISFVHWHTIQGAADPGIPQMSRHAYRELLWHMLFRGTDTFFMWSMKEEFPQEVSLVQEVYAQGLQYKEFLQKGWPVTFDISDKPGTVISGLALDDRVLIRRTDFGTDHSPVRILIGTKAVTVEYAPEICKVFKL